MTTLVRLVRAGVGPGPGLALLLLVVLMLVSRRASAQGRTGPDADAGAESPAAPPAGAGADESDAGDQVVDLSNEADLVSSLDRGPNAGPKTPPAPVKPDRFEFRGFARMTGAVSVAPVRADSGAPQERVPYDRAFIEQHLYLDLRYARGTWFQAVASGSLSFAAFHQVNEPSSGAPTTAIDPQRLDAILREAYVGFSLGRLDLRIGQQRIAWGSSDAYAPNDVLNGRDVRNPFLFDSEMLVLPTPAVRADIDLGVAILGLVFEPFVPSDRFDLYGTNWALLQADAPRAYRRLFGTLSQGLDRNQVASLQDTLTGGQLSGSNPANASLGGSLKMHVGRFDLSWYFLTGFDRQPAVYVDPAFQKQLESIDASQLNGGVFDALLNQTRASTRALGGPVLLSYRRRNHVGMDAQTTAGPFVLRADLAYDSSKTFFSADSFNSILRPAVQEVLGLEYQTGSLNRVIGVEAWAMQVLSPETRYVPALEQGPPSALLWYKDNNYGVGSLVRWTFFDDGIIEVRSTVNIDPLWYSARPEIGYQSSTFTVRAGFLGIGGDDGAFGGYYRRNSTAYITSRFSF
jgi:hypothetical protein